MGSLLTLAATGLAALALATAAVASRPTEGGSTAVETGWAAQQIATVVAAGVMGPDVDFFRADEPLTRLELFDALLALGLPAQEPADPAGVVTMRELDATLVSVLGLRGAATRIRVVARDAALAPRPYLGTETVARLLGLRVNHPQGQEQLERIPNDAAPRAEAAYSLARVMTLSPEQVAAIDALAQSFALPELTYWQEAVLSRGLRFVGFPYVFAGSSEKPQRIWSAAAAGGLVDAPAGFDCSGLVWRVFKLEPFAEAPQLASVIEGRTTYVMSAEVPPALRIGFDQLEPGDVLFFGARGTRSKPSQVGHAGMYVGNGWFVHSSSNGVTLQPLQGWYLERFAWARRPLAEAGLTA